MVEKNLEVGEIEVLVPTAAYVHYLVTFHLFHYTTRYQTNM